ncbi:prophage CP4-like integrase [gamma proteobacterium IMCC1989]|nr:prophage CP4-like integrase [gamma proteobacterium IMCC1989]
MTKKKYLTDKLSNLEIKKATAKDKDYWMDDGGSLRLLVKRTGTKCWRYNYRFGGKQKTLAIGIYPDISLAKARSARMEAKNDIANGIDPAQKKQDQKRSVHQVVELTFANMAEEWWNHQKGTWKDHHANRVWTRLKDNSFPLVGHRAIEDISPQDVIAIIREIEQRNALDVAQRVLQDMRRVFRYAVQTGRLTNNPASELSDILKPRKTTHRASLPREDLPQFLKDLQTYDKQGRLITRLAIELLVLTFVRPGELRGTKWEEISLEDKLWRIPGERMKMGGDHLVPLSKQAIAIINQLKPISGHYDLVFPSERSRFDCMSDNTMRRAIFKLGYDGNTKGKRKVTPHGFRATASSILNEANFNPDAIERQLSHMERNGVRAAYTHHARYLDERKDMMQQWADYLDELRESGKVVPMPSNKATA